MVVGTTLKVKVGQSESEPDVTRSKVKVKWSLNLQVFLYTGFRPPCRLCSQGLLFLLACDCSVIVSLWSDSRVPALVGLQHSSTECGPVFVDVDMLGWMF